MLDLVDESTDVGEQLNGKLISSLNKLLGILSSANTRRRTGQNDGTSGQGSALGKEADQLGNAEDQITANDTILAISFPLLSRKITWRSRLT